MRHAVRLVHAFLTEQRFYAVALFSSAGITLLLGRYLASGSRAFAFLLWNLFLAFIPYTLSSAAAALDRTRSPGRSFLLVFLAAPWLAFLPNAPYLVTDLVHLRTPSSVPVWYDVTMFACFAGAGCLLGAASLDTMRKVFSRRVGIVAAQGSALGALALSAVGIYLGRVLRLNSWDLVLRPGRVLDAARGALWSREALLFVALFGGFLVMGYTAIAWPGSPRGDSRDVET